MEGFPIIGSGLSLIGKSQSELSKKFEETSRQLGPLWRVDLSPFHCYVVIHDPKVIEDILTSRTVIEKSAEYDSLKGWLGEGNLDN